MNPPRRTNNSRDKGDSVRGMIIIVCTVYSYFVSNNLIMLVSYPNRSGNVLMRLDLPQPTHRFKPKDTSGDILLL
jgi:hypothetical protein